MAEERGVPTRPVVAGDGAPVVATTERTGEGDVYYTGPRPAVAQTALAAPTFRDLIRWQSIIGGIIAALTTMAVLSMLGIAIGFSVFGSGSDGGAIGTAIAVWSAISAFIAFIVGGWVAGKTAGVGTLGNALLNGFLVGATVLVILLWATAAGVGNIFGLIGSSAGGILHAGITDPNGLRSAMSNTASLAGNNAPTISQSDAATSAWIIFGATIIGLIAATLGGWFGWVTRLPGETVVRR